MRPLTVSPDGGRRSITSLKASIPRLSDFQLIDAPELEQLLGSPHEQCQLIEAHFSSTDHPLAGIDQRSPHLPGALQMHPSYLEAGTDRSKYYPNYDHPTDGNLLPDHELTLALENVGIFPETLVIVYGTDPDGSMAAARLTWALLYAGVQRVRFLDGGIRSWITHGNETSSLIEIAGTTPDPLKSPSAKWQIRSEFLATTDEVSRLNSSHGKLIDVRRRDEWDGTNPNQYSFFSKAGHIPSAEYQGDWKNLVDQNSDKIGPLLNSVAQRWRDQGILDADVASGKRSLIFYCGTGWRSSIAFLVALSLGLRAKNYDDGFYGWSWDEENEIIYGETTPASR